MVYIVRPAFNFWQGTFFSVWTAHAGCYWKLVNVQVWVVRVAVEDAQDGCNGICVKSGN